MHKTLKYITIFFLIPILICTAALPFPFSADAASGDVIVVLDPGHGGSSDGAFYYGLKEKDLNLCVAQLTGLYLSQFEGITVYLTRTADVDVSLADRAKFADTVNADFFYSIHFNASDQHNMFGSEVWVSAFGENYVKGYQFAKILLTNFSDHIGLYSRGCKTRLNSKGSDYYGVIRMTSGLYDIPSCIIEHCHIDNADDVQNFMTSETLQQMAYQDAISIAQYFGLSSKSLGLDFSGYSKVSCIPPVCFVPDTTAPDFAVASLTSSNKTSKTATVMLNGIDLDSSIKYYSYSLNHGLTWSALFPYAGGPTTVTVPLNTINDTILFRVYNQYDLFTTSNPIDPF